MAPKTALSQRDAEVIVAAFQSLKNSADIDYDKLAEKAGYKNRATARACFSDVKKRLNALVGEDADPPTTKKHAPAKSNKRKELTPGDSSPTLAGSSPGPEDDDESKVPATKKKKTSTSKGKGKKPIITTPETEDDINNKNAIAAGRARYVAEKLAAEIKAEPMDDDADEDEGLSAYELVAGQFAGEA